MGVEDRGREREREMRVMGIEGGRERELRVHGNRGREGES